MSINRGEWDVLVLSLVRFKFISYVYYLTTHFVFISI